MEEYRIYIARGGETWDRIAFDSWADESLMYILIQANPLLADIVVFEGGEKVRIPLSVTSEKSPKIVSWRL